MRINGIYKETTEHYSTWKFVLVGLLFIAHLLLDKKF